MNLSDADKNILLTLARGVIAKRISTTENHHMDLPEPTDSVQVKCGVFVSLYADEKLRGCIGTFSEDHSLYRNVEEMALSAALSDTRFDPIELHEIEKLVIEISVLTPRERIFEKNEIVLGKHGIYMEHGINRGTLLPQVAISQKWTVDEFLGNCSKYKAGIGWTGWKAAHLYRYEAIVFSSKNSSMDC